MVIGIVNNLNEEFDGFVYVSVVEFINSYFFVLKQYFEGIKLFGVVFDNVVVGILSIGEYILVMFFSVMLFVKGIVNCVIDLVKYVLVEGDYLDSIVDVLFSKVCFLDVFIDGSEFFVMLGFVVVNEVGEKVMFGCNGLDYLVVILVVCIDVNCCEIWIDVDGVYNVDLN